MKKKSPVIAAEQRKIPAKAIDIPKLNFIVSLQSATTPAVFEDSVLEATNLGIIEGIPLEKTVVNKIPAPINKLICPNSPEETLRETTGRSSKGIPR